LDTKVITFLARYPPNYINKILEIHKIKYSKNTKRTLFPGEFHAIIYLSIDDRTGVYGKKIVSSIILLHSFCFFYSFLFVLFSITMADVNRNIGSTHQIHVHELAGYRPGRRGSFPIISAFQTCTSNSNSTVSFLFRIANVIFGLKTRLSLTKFQRL